MQKNYLFLGILLLCTACRKDDGNTPKQVIVTAKVLDYDTNKPIKDVVVRFSGYEITPSLQVGLSDQSSTRTDVNGIATLSLEDKPDFNYSLNAGIGEFVDIDEDKYIQNYAYRNIEDRLTTTRMLNHTFRFIEGGTIQLKCELDAIISKDSLELDVYQLRKGERYTNLKSYGSYALSFFEKNLQYAGFQMGFIANSPIYINYRYASKKVWKSDTLQFPKGYADNHLLKY